MRNLLLLIIFLLAHPCFALTWTPINSPTSLNIKSCSFINADTGWVITDDLIFKTTDGGMTWVSQPFPPDPAFDARFCNTVDFFDANVGIIACGNYLYNGHDPNQVSDFLWTNDGGNTWTYRNFGWAEDYILDARLSSPSKAYGIGQYGSVTMTSDSGNTWTDLSYVSQYTGQRLFPLNADTVYFAGVANISNDAAFGKIWNGTWTAWTVVNQAATTFFTSLYFFDPLKGWIAGSNGLLYKTTDGGNNWSAGSSGVTSNINDITFVNDTDGWFVTASGKIYRTINGGGFWSAEYNGTTVLNDICIKGTTGYAVGNGGLILKTDLTTSVTEDRPISFNIFPDPATDALSIHVPEMIPGKTEIRIYNELGMLVHREVLNSADWNLDVSEWKAGIYMITLNEDRETAAQKFLISH